MLINLTNHPSVSWSNEQRMAAEVYGKIVDLPFPQVDPNCTETEIDRLSDDYLCRILGYGDDCVVHIMGELTFVFSLVNKLKQRGVTCVASTTARVVIDKGNGLKESQFKFVSFRMYC